MRKALYFILGLVACFVIYQFLRPSKGEYYPQKLTISTVHFGVFREYIPQTGEVVIDSGLVKSIRIVVPIDEFYIDRIKVGLKATTSIQDKEFQLRITDVNPEIAEGRFHVNMSFTDSIPTVSAGKSIRMRIELGDPSNQLLLPMGGFYKDTGGKWVFVINSNDQVIRTNIKLGRKSGSEYFEVLEGLKPGDRVISSSYEEFAELDSIPLSEVAEYYDQR